MLFETANKRVHTGSLNLSYCGITCLHTQQAQVHLTREFGISSTAGMLAHSSRTEPWYFAFCHLGHKD